MKVHRPPSVVCILPSSFVVRKSLISQHAYTAYYRNNLVVWIIFYSPITQVYIPAILHMQSCQVHDMNAEFLLQGTKGLWLAWHMTGGMGRLLTMPLSAGLILWRCWPVTPAKHLLLNNNNNNNIIRPSIAQLSAGALQDLFFFRCKQKHPVGWSWFLLLLYL